jgi:hypothetical protein
MNKVNHAKFEKKYGGKVFFIYSTDKKEIHNKEVIDEISMEIERLKVFDK